MGPSSSVAQVITALRAGCGIPLMPDMDYRLKYGR
jgi:hypothetical protein